IDQLAGPLDNIEMPVGQWIERAGIEPNQPAHGGLPIVVAWVLSCARHGGKRAARAHLDIAGIDKTLVLQLNPASLRLCYVRGQNGMLMPNLDFLTLYILIFLNSLAVAAVWAGFAYSYRPHRA